MDVKKEKKNVDHLVSSQTDRLNTALYCIGNREIEVSKKLSNSQVGRETELIRKTINKLWLEIDSLKITDFVTELKAVLIKKRNIREVNKIVREQVELIEKLNELIRELAKTNDERKELTKKCEKLEMERSVLEHVIKSTYEENNKTDCLIF